MIAAGSGMPAISAREPPRGRLLGYLAWALGSTGWASAAIRNNPTRFVSVPRGSEALCIVVSLGGESPDQVPSIPYLIGALCFSGVVSRRRQPPMVRTVAEGEICPVWAARHSAFPAPAIVPPGLTKNSYRLHFAPQPQGDGTRRRFAGTVLHSRYPSLPTVHLPSTVGFPYSS